MDTSLYALINTGQVEYSIEEARMPIGDFIAQLQRAQEDGAEFVVALTGNYRGAKYVRLSDIEVEYADGI